MKTISNLLPASLLAVAVALPGVARAETVAFEYDGSISPSWLACGNNGGGIGFVEAAAAQSSAELGSSAATLMNVATMESYSSAEASAPDTCNSSFAVTIRLRDLACNSTATLTFSASLAGSLTSGDASVSII